MKITNLSTQELKIPMKKSSGHKLIVSLRPGQFVYSESEDKYANKQLIIWERKKAIEIIEEELPKALEYCHPYSILPKNQIPKTKTIVLVEEDDDDDDDNVTSIPEVSVPEDVIDDSEDEDIVDFSEDKDMVDDSEDDIDEKESEVSTNIDNSNIKKGGRPKGSKNKDKRGRKKTKKGRGRPSKNKTSVNDSNLNTDVI